MYWFTARVQENHRLAKDFAHLSLQGCQPLVGARPGQFVMMRGAWGRDPILPRAYSVLGVEEDVAQFLIRLVGRGSTLLGGAKPGDVITVLGPLGTFFPEPASGMVDLLVAGGCGLPPLYMAARRAQRAGKGSQVELLIGARVREDLVLQDGLAELGIKVSTITEDGSDGSRGGLVTDLLERGLQDRGADCRVFACGPEPMLLAVRDLSRKHGAPCYLSLEANMACGLGACLGCAVPGRDTEYLHVCKDGPVFDAEEVWP